MFVAVLSLIIILAVLLILVVLIQNSKGGLTQSMGSASSQLIGVKRTTDFLEKITWGLAVSIMVLCLVSNLVIEKPGVAGEEDITSINLERTQEGGSAQPAPTAPSTTEDSAN